MDVNQFIDNVCFFYNLDLDKLKSNYKKGVYADVRKMIAFKLFYKYNLKQSEIAVILNKASHSSVSISIRKHISNIEYDKKYRELFNLMSNLQI